MKIINNIFLISYSISISINNLEILEIINLAEYDTKKTNLTNAGICLNIKKIDDNKKYYLYLSSKNGSINETLKYEFLNDKWYTNYTYDPENNKLKLKRKTRSTSYNKEFSFEYKIKKNNKKMIMFCYIY